MQRVCMQYACRYAGLQACIFELAIQQIWDLDVYIYTCAIAINIKYIFIHFCRASWELKRICRCTQLSTKCGQIHLVKSYSRAFFKNQQITFEFQSSRAENLYHQRPFGGWDHFLKPGEGTLLVFNSIEGRFQIRGHCHHLLPSGKLNIWKLPKICRNQDLT